MKCLLVADLHYDLRKFDWVVAVAAHVDLVVLAGDHLDAGGRVDRKAQAVIVQKYFRRIRASTPLLVCSGNHDLDHADGHGELVTRWIAKARHIDVATDGDSRLIGDTLFSVCPWAEGPTNRAAIKAQLARDAEARPARWVWIHHAPPIDSPTSWDGRHNYGDPRLRRLIERHQPDLVLSGHVHQSPFTAKGSWADQIGQTWVFNAGHQIGPEPSHIVIDTKAPEASWISLAGAEHTPLDAPPARPFPPITEPPAWLLAMARPAAQPPG